MPVYVQCKNGVGGSGENGVGGGEEHLGGRVRDKEMRERR